MSNWENRELQRGDIVQFDGEQENSSFLPFTPNPGIIVSPLGSWGYLVNWALDGFSTSEKGRYLRKVGHVED